MINIILNRTVLITEPVSKEVVDKLIACGFTIKRGSGLGEGEIINDLSGCEAVIIRAAKITRRIIEESPSLRIIAKHGSGLDSIDLEAAFDHKITVINSPGFNSISVAEHTIGLVIACAHSLLKNNKEYEKGNYYDKDISGISEISGKTIGLVGYGNVSKKVAEMASNGFSMKVLVYDPYIDILQSNPNILLCESIETLISSSDFISLHVPATNNTYHMVDKFFISKMKKTAFLINTSRGSVVDNDALVDALKHKKIAGAGLDVTEPEPLPQNHYLLNDLNVIVTPHSAASSREAMLRMGESVVNDLVLYFMNKKPIHIVSNLFFKRF